MFVEIPRAVFEKLKKKLEEMGIPYEVSDCTIPGESSQVVHVELPDSLSPEEIRVINNEIDFIYGAVAEYVLDRDKDGNGVPDRYDNTEGGVREVRHRTWDEKGHTPLEEARGYLTGESVEEEVSYEST